MVLFGYPMPSVEIKIDKPNEEGIGEIVAKGPNVMLGYYEDEEATKECLVNRLVPYRRFTDIKIKME